MGKRLIPDTESKLYADIEMRGSTQLNPGERGLESGAVESEVMSQSLRRSQMKSLTVSQSKRHHEASGKPFDRGS